MRTRACDKVDVETIGVVFLLKQQQKKEEDYFNLNYNQLETKIKITARRFCHLNLVYNLN